MRDSDIAELMAGQTAILAMTLKLLIDKKVISVEDVNAFIDQLMSEHARAGSDPKSAAALNHLKHILSSRSLTTPPASLN